MPINDFWRTKKLNFKPLKLKSLTTRGQSLYPSKRNLSWQEGKQQMPWISGNVDSDRDGVINKNDCRPWNPLRQDITEEEQAQQFVEISEEKEPLSKEEIGELQKFGEKVKRPEALNVYVFVNGKWHWMGKFKTDENFDRRIQEFSENVGGKVIVDERDNLENQLNRQLLTGKVKTKLRHTGEKIQRAEEKMHRAGVVVEDYAERQKFGENIKAGMKFKPGAGRAMKRFSKGSGRPPIRTRPRRLSPEEKLSPNFQQKSVFPNTSPYRPLSVAQTMPKLAMITSPAAERMRSGERWKYPQQPRAFMPPFLKIGLRRQQQEVTYEEETKKT